MNILCFLEHFSSLIIQKNQTPNLGIIRWIAINVNIQKKKEQENLAMFLFLNQFHLIAPPKINKVPNEQMIILIFLNAESNLNYSEKTIKSAVELLQKLYFISFRVSDHPPLLLIEKPGRMCVMELHGCFARRCYRLSITISAPTTFYSTVVRLLRNYSMKPNQSYRCN